MTSAVGIFGGTFDPPHLGHLILAEACADALALSRVLWVPAADPPHKQDVAMTPARHRVKMVKAAIAGNPRFALSRVDVDRPGPHYSADMVDIIAEQHRDAPLYFLMGGDSLRDLPNWHEPARLLARCALGVIRRPGDDLASVLPSLHEKISDLKDNVYLIEAPLVEIAGSEIRRRVGVGESVRYRVLDAVRVYIEQENLYR